MFVGEKKSGKSSLIARFLDEPYKEDMKETTALDYKFGTRIKDERRQKVNIYELGKVFTPIKLIRRRQSSLKSSPSSVELF